MTQEEKAKAYDEALGWMRKVYPTLTGADKEDAEHYFPELAESEDEKIREDIMVAVENWHTCERVEEIRFYLRKQKEQKDYRKLYEEVVNSDWFKENYKGKSLGEEKQKEQKPTENGGKELLYVSNKSYNIGYRDGKREAEQKTAEWSEEDEKIIESINMVFDMCAAKNIATEETTLYKLRAWLKSFRPTHWKPSEEQMDALKSKLPIIKGTGNNVDSILESLYEQLKKL